MFVIVKVPANDAGAKRSDMKELLAPKPAGYVPYDMRVNGCERERLDAIDALNCAVRYAVKHKIDNPFAKELLNGLYGIGTLQFSDHEGEPDPRGVDNTCAENAKNEKRCDECGDDVSYPHKLRLEHPEVVLGVETVIRKLMEVKKEYPFVKELLNGLYGVNYLRGTENNGEPDPAGHNAISENVKDDSRDIFVTVNSDHVSPQTMHEIAKLIAVLSDTDRDIHVNVV